MLRIGLPVSGLELLLAGSGLYFASEHEKGKHGQAHVLCPICWLNKIAPATEPPEGSAESEQDRP